MFRMMRKFARVLRSWPFWLGMLGITMLLLAAHPWWLAAGLRVLLAREGISVGQWQVEGYRSYVLSDVRIDLAQGRGSVGRIESNQALSWLWQLRSGPQQRPYLRADDVKWQIAVVELDAAQSGEPFPGASAIYDMLLDWQPLLEKWAPYLRAKQLTVTRENQEIKISEFLWQDGEVALDFSYPVADLLANLQGPLIGPWELSLRSPLHPAELRLFVSPKQDAERLQLNWQVAWAPLRARGGVLFAGSQPIPVVGDGHWRLDNLRGAEFGLPQLEQLSGTLKLDWKDERWRLSADLEGDWMEGEIRVPVLLQLQASGDTASAELEALSIATPWADADLSQSAPFDFEKRQFTDPFVFNLDLDLGKIPVAGLAGQLKLSLESEPWVGEGDPPAVKFALDSEHVRYEESLIRDLSAAGSFSFPELQLKALQFQWGEGTSIAGHFDYNFATKNWRELRLDAQLLHSDLDTWVTLPASWPESSDWNLASDGEWADGFSAKAILKGVAADFSAALEMEWQQIADGWQGDAQVFDIQHGGERRLSLHQEAEAYLKWDGGSHWTVRDWQFDAYDGSSLSLSTVIGDGDVPLLDIHLQQFDSAQWSAYLPAAWQRFRVENFAIGWASNASDGMFEQWHLQSHGWIEVDVLPDARGVRFAMDIEGSPQGVNIDQFEWVGRDLPFVRGHGYLPMSLGIEDFAPQFVPLAGRPIDWDFELVSRPTLVELLQGFLDTHVEDPMLSLRLGGDWQRPEGRLQLNATSLRSEWLETDFPFTLDNLRLSILLDPSGLELEYLEFSYNEQPFSAKASLPMDEDDWLAVWDKQGFPYADRARGEILIDAFQMEALAPLLPDFIGRSGQINAQLRLDPGGQLHGFAELENASTRPLPTGSALRNINGRIRFSGTKIGLENMTAYIERHRLDLSGSADFSQWQDPAVDLHFTGENLPLLRQDDMILRADADLRLSKAAGQPGKIHGEVSFRESLMLRDMRSMMRPGVATASARPPFFSVEAEPFNLWTFDILLLSDRALRVQSPFFYGRISSDLQLLGRLEGPYLLGELSVPRGAVVFPFGNVRIEDGLIRFLQADPHDPQLQIRGQAESLGYTVQMEVTGSAYDPLLRFTSNPPLAQDEIIMLMTTGMLPSGDDSGAVGQRIALFLGRGLAGDLFGGTEESWTRNLIIKGGGRQSETGRDTYRIEYRLSEDFSVYGENDVFDEYNVGLRWRFYTR